MRSHGTPGQKKAADSAAFLLCLPQNLTACWQCPFEAALSSPNIIQSQ